MKKLVFTLLALTINTTSVFAYNQPVSPVPKYPVNNDVSAGLVPGVNYDLDNDMSYIPGQAPNIPGYNYGVDNDMSYIPGQAPNIPGYNYNVDNDMSASLVP
ncbi:hypothetical protein AN639_00265 [Candidatus Epulonipiscium fishelsonii]|nr:hypothetical protein AN639_00265 [Epulopiscium sp. SCG-B05WGA-EpuloA1]